MRVFFLVVWGSVPHACFPISKRQSCYGKRKYSQSIQSTGIVVPMILQILGVWEESEQKSTILNSLDQLVIWKAGSLYMTTLYLNSSLHISLYMTMVKDS